MQITVPQYRHSTDVAPKSRERSNKLRKVSVVYFGDLGKRFATIFLCVLLTELEIVRLNYRDGRAQKVRVGSVSSDELLIATGIL